MINRIVARYWEYVKIKKLCNQCQSPLTLWVRVPLRRGVLDTTVCDKVCQWLATSRWFSPETPVSCINKTEILLKVALNAITITLNIATDMHWRHAKLRIYANKIFEILIKNTQLLAYNLKVNWLLTWLWSKLVTHMTEK